MLESSLCAEILPFETGSQSDCAWKCLIYTRGGGTTTTTFIHISIKRYITVKLFILKKYYSP